VTLKANDAGKASIVILATLDDPSGGGEVHLRTLDVL